MGGFSQLREEKVVFIYPYANILLTTKANFLNCHQSYVISVVIALTDYLYIRNAE